MKRIFTYAVLAYITHATIVNAQSIERSIVSSSGDIFKTELYTLEFTLGDIAIETFKTNELLLTQGFVQPDEAKINTIKNYTSGFECNIYPNPANTHVFINTNQNLNKEPDLEIFDIDGKMVIKDKIVSMIMKVDIHQLKAGIYFIQIQDHDLNINKTSKLFIID